MHYSVHVVDRGTGADLAVVVEAASPEEARAAVARDGRVIGEARPAVVVPVERSMRPARGVVLTAERVSLFFQGGSFLMLVLLYWFFRVFFSLPGRH